ncbi:hypothetical protein OROGR_006382 [Orobanche gracilis]
MQKMKGPRPRYSKPTTIHGSAQSGDINAFQKLLLDNHLFSMSGTLLNGTNTLHVSAGYNSIEIVKFLLDCRGPEKVELEAKNMYGETPLHMAAKNGCNEAAKCLLVPGALVEAKANNGMTPLHLAVWHSLRAEDWSTVNTLLEYNVDCSAEDNEGITPLDHLSQGPAKMVALENELSSIVGLNAFKLQLEKWAKGMLLDERRRALGLKVGARRPPHMAFLGNPGTGKTMVARVLGKLLHMVGILQTDRVTEVQMTDLVGEFVGHTGPKTRRKVQEAEGGILFVDEAYRLIPMQKSDDKDYGLEALEEIMSVMDSGKVVVIFAGYSEPMKRVISSNEGFCRRVTKFFHFDDFSSEDLAKILHLKMCNPAEDSLLCGFKLHPSCTVEAVAALIKREMTEKQRQEMNGGLIDPMLVNAREHLDSRIDFDCIDTDSLLTITLEDLAVGLQLLAH